MAEALAGSEDSVDGDVVGDGAVDIDKELIAASSDYSGWTSSK